MTIPAEIRARSLAEARFYLEINPCRSCRNGRLEIDQIETEDRHIDHVLRFEAVCQRCGHRHVQRFRIDASLAEPQEPPIINPTSVPSQIIDVAQWITLAHLLATRSESPGDRQSAHQAACWAGLCLEEALKFYEDPNELPPDSAFLDAVRRRQARAYPQQYARTVLIDLRRRLPGPAPRRTK
jgi:hypothetical protein